MKPYILFLFLSVCFCLQACKTVTPAINPPAVGFDAEHSDTKAIQLADDVMAAMGGYEAWTSTKYIHWNFFGSRTLLWDKERDRVRIESQKDDFKAVVNINNLSGQVMKSGQLLTNTDSLTKYLTQAKNIWINDSYWLVMPFKLKDSGVTLNYLRQQKTEEGEMAEVVSMTFKNVGVTPQNKYHVFIDPETKLVTQWSFYTKSNDEEARFSTPWASYEKHGDILLSGDRGGDYQLTEIWVKDIVEAGAFELK